MNQPIGQRDRPGFPDGDRAWVGIDMTRDKPSVQPGFLSLGQNTRLRTSKVRQRYGTTIPADFNRVDGFNNFLVGSGVFNNPNGQEVLMVAPSGTQYVWALQDGKDAVQVNYNGAIATNNGDYVEFCQAFDKILLLRRPVVSGGVNLEWDGINGHTFNTVVLSGTGLSLVPGNASGIPYQDRLIFWTISAVAPSRDTF